MSLVDLTSIPLVYPDISGTNQYTNVLLIDNSVFDYQIVVNSVNETTFPIVYSMGSTKNDLLALLQAKFTTIPRIGFFFTSSSGQAKPFLDGEPLFVDDETMPYSTNMQFILDIITEFQVKNIDYLACDTLNYPNWKNYYDVLMNETGVTVGASSDQTGNIFYGGDWVLESTNEDVELTYFTQSIEYYTYLLDNASWATLPNRSRGIINGNDGYFYVALVDNQIYKVPINNPASPISWYSGLLATPIGMCIYNNYLYVANNNGFGGTGGIVRIDMTNASANTYATSTQGCQNPRWVVTDGTYLYVSNYGGGTISRMLLTDPTATTDSASWVTGFNGPSALVINGNYLYVADTGNNRISKILLSTGAVIDYNWVTSAKGLSGPNGMTFYKNCIFVANTGSNSKIFVINIDSANVITSFTPIVTSSWALEIYGGNIYQVNESNSNIYQINLPIDPYIVGNGYISGNGYFIPQ